MNDLDLRLEVISRSCQPLRLPMVIATVAKYPHPTSPAVFEILDSKRIGVTIRHRSGDH